MSRKANDLNNQRFGDWTVISRAENRNGKSYWNCKCALCERTFEVRGSALTSGRSTCCYDCGRRKSDDLTGKVFGEWTVLTNECPKCLCRCSCGETRYVSRGNLTFGSTTDCGHVHKQQMKEDAVNRMLNKKFGMLTVVSLSHIINRTYYYNCICECSNPSVVSEGELVSGGTISCGCLLSKMERDIKIWLTEHNIKFDAQQTTFSDLKTDKGGTPRFDIKAYKADGSWLLIEAQGKQHETAWPGKEWFGQTEREYTDKLKKEYCFTHGIQLEEIWYNENLTKRLEKIFIHDNPVPSVNE